ncbi:hypothetical protein IQ26_06449 [Mesorhizobium tianshanense]|uniref:Transposase n=1 Tax=Mesorhizobium tianshanense TaxID=39844 RepID=A0A562MT91_9HYPH|nr:hypothetical protein IQ26_06449 [Mesorhizobium tianshanense]
MSYPGAQHCALTLGRRWLFGLNETANFVLPVPLNTTPEPSVRMRTRDRHRTERIRLAGGPKSTLRERAVSLALEKGEAYRQGRPRRPRQLRRSQPPQGARLARPQSALHFPLHDLVRVAHAIEGFFAKLSKRRLKRGAFHTVVDLQAQINRYLAEHNHQPKPFAWTADPDKIHCCRQTRALSVRFHPLGC